MRHINAYYSDGTHRKIRYYGTGTYYPGNGETVSCLSGGDGLSNTFDIVFLDDAGNMIQMPQNEDTSEYNSLLKVPAGEYSVEVITGTGDNAIKSDTTLTVTDYPADAISLVPGGTASFDGVSGKYSYYTIAANKGDKYKITLSGQAVGENQNTSYTPYINQTMYALQDGKIKSVSQYSANSYYCGEAEGSSYIIFPESGTYCLALSFYGNLSGQISLAEVERVQSIDLDVSALSDVLTPGSEHFLTEIGEGIKATVTTSSGAKWTVPSDGISWTSNIHGLHAENGDVGADVIISPETGESEEDNMYLNPYCILAGGGKVVLQPAESGNSDYSAFQPVTVDTQALTADEKLSEGSSVPGTKGKWYSFTRSDSDEYSWKITSESSSGTSRIEMKELYSQNSYLMGVSSYGTSYILSGKSAFNDIYFGQGNTAYLYLSDVEGDVQLSVERKLPVTKITLQNASINRLELVTENLPETELFKRLFVSAYYGTEDSDHSWNPEYSSTWSGSSPDGLQSLSTCGDKGDRIYFYFTDKDGNHTTVPTGSYGSVRDLPEGTYYIRAEYQYYLDGEWKLTTSGDPVTLTVTGIPDDLLDQAEEITVGETKAVSWNANDLTKKYLKFTPGQTGSYTFSCAGSVNCYAYIIDSVSIRKLSEQYIWGNYSGGITAQMTAGTEYLLKLSRNSEDSSKGRTLLVTLDRTKTPTWAKLIYDGKTPEFIEGLVEDYPVWLFGEVKAELPDVESGEKKTYQIKNGNSFSAEGGYYYLQSISDFDENGQPLYTGEPGEGSYYLILGGNGILPNEEQNGTFTPSLASVANIPFNVISRKTAAERHVFDTAKASVTLAADYPYYVGTEIKADKTGYYQFSSDQLLSDIQLYEVAEDGTEEKIASHSSSSSLKAILKQGTTYYLFAEPKKAGTFTINVKKETILQKADASSSLPENIKGGTAQGSAFAVDLTYDDGTQLQLRAGEEDIYGNSFRFSMDPEDEDGSSYYFVSGSALNTEGVDGDDSKAIRSGKYTMSAQSKEDSVVQTQDGPSLQKINAGIAGEVTVEAPDEAGPIALNKVEKIGLGEQKLFSFVPEETGLYSILRNGSIGKHFLEKDAKGHYVTVDTDFPGIASLEAGKTYYVAVYAEYGKVQVAVTRRRPVTGEGTYLVPEYENGESSLLLQVPEDGYYKITAQTSENSNPDLTVYGKDADATGSSWIEDEGGRVFKLQKEVIYQLGTYSYEKADDPSAYTVTFNVAKTDAPATESDDQKTQDEVTAEILTDTIDYPVQFADEWVYWTDELTVRETSVDGKKTADVKVEEKSPLSGRTYFVQQVYGSGKKRLVSVRSESSNEDLEKVVQFTGDLSGAPSVTPGTENSSGLSYGHARFYRFEPQTDGEYSIATRTEPEEDNGDSIYVCEESENRIIWSDVTYQLNAGEKYLIEVVNESGTEPHPLLVTKEEAGVKEVRKVEFTSYPDRILREGIRDAEAEVTVTYEDNTTWTTQVRMSSYVWDQKGNYLEMNAALVPQPEGKQPMVRIIASIGGMTTHVDLPLKDPAELEKAAVSSENAKAVSSEAGKEKICWYQFVPDADGVYTLFSTSDSGIALYKVIDSETGAVYEGIRPVSMKAGRRYLVRVDNIDAQNLKVWVGKYSDDTRDYTRKVTYGFKLADGSSFPEGMTGLPKEVMDLLPEEESYLIGADAEVRELSEEQKKIGLPYGVWVFNGFDREGTFCVSSDVTITGTWQFAAEVHDVKYEAKSEKEGVDLPKEVLTLMPQTQKNVAGGKTVKPDQPEKTEITLTDEAGKKTKWTFTGYDKDSAVIGSEDVVFNGTWKPVSVYMVAYKFLKAEKDQGLTFAGMPEDPKAVEAAEGDPVPDAPKVAETTVRETDGTWFFDGFDCSALPEKVTSDISVNGTWHFEAKTAAQDAVSTIASAGAGKPVAEIADELTGSDSAEVKSALEDQAKSELTQEGKTATDGAVVGKVSDYTQKLDQALEGQTVTYKDPASEDKTAMVGSTVQADSIQYKGKDSGLKAEVTGATPTAASEARSDAVNGDLENNSEYRAAIKVTPTQMVAPGEGLKPGLGIMRMDISMNVETVRNGEVVDIKQNVEPVSPITITLTMPAAYSGSSFKLYHFEKQPDGSTKRVSVPLELVPVNKIRFVVASLSEFEVEITCLHDKKVFHAAVPATCTKDGNSAYYECSSCKELFDKDGNAISKIPAVKAAGHRLVRVAAKAATCTAPGNEAYSKCSVCGKLFDSQGREIGAVPVTPAKGHSYGEWQTTQEATVLAPGIMTRVCSNDISHVETKSIAALPATLKVMSGKAIVSGTLPMKKGQKFGKLTAQMGLGDYIESVTSSKTKAVTVTWSGNSITLKARKNGTAIITVRTAGNAAVTFKVKVGKNKPVAKKVVGLPKKLTLQAKQTTALDVYVIPVTVTDKMKFKSSNKKVAAVTGGVIRAKKKGKATITVTVGKKKYTCKVTVR